MTLEQLRIFVAVAEREHVTRAAADLNLTQSATSAAVAALEARYAIKLFNRIGRQIELTQAGRLFLVEARAVLARAAAAETVLADLAGLKRGSLTIAASQTVGNYWLPPLMHRYRTEYPGIALGLTIGNTETVVAAVRDGIADLGFVEGPMTTRHLSVTPVADDELVLVVSAALPRLKRRRRRDGRPQGHALGFAEPGSQPALCSRTPWRRPACVWRTLDVILERHRTRRSSPRSRMAPARPYPAEACCRGLARIRFPLLLDFALPKRQFFVLRHQERSITQAERELYKLIDALPQPTSRRTVPSTRTKRH